MARADSMGIDYDDIAHCFEYPSDQNETSGELIYNMESLEPCKFGISYDNVGAAANSIVGQLDLMCSRQWMRVLFGLMVPLGLLGGSIMYSDELTVERKATRQDFRTVRTMSSKTAALVPWLALILISVNHMLILDHHGQQEKSDEKYISLVACSFLRSVLVMQVTLNAIRGATTSSQEQPMLNGPRMTSYTTFLLFVFIMIVSKFTVVPLALRFSQNWSDLNLFLSGNILFLGGLNVVRNLVITKNEQIHCTNDGRLRAREIDLKNTSDVITLLNLMRPGDDQNAETHESAMPSVDRISMNIGEAQNPTDRGRNMKVCEVCLLRDVGSFSSSSPYPPTTMPLGNNYRPVVTIGPTARPSSSRCCDSSFGAVHLKNSAEKSTQLLIILAFCLSYNYFLIQTMPDHKMLHAESIVSLDDRKLLFRSANLEHKRQEESKSELMTYETHGIGNNYVPAHKITTDLHQSDSRDHLDHGPLGISHRPSSERRPITIVPTFEIVSNELSDHRNQSKEDLDKLKNHNSSNTVFNYWNGGYAMAMMETLKMSSNPIAILLNTIYLNGWPIEVVIMMLHVANIANIKRTFFSLNRLFSISLHGSKVLIFEWLVIALMSQKKSHLIERDWLMSLVRLFTRSVTSLMVYQYFSSLTELSSRLNDKGLVNFKLIISSALSAIIVAMFAPICERIDLMIIPFSIILNNVLIYFISRKLKDLSKDLLCPMVFEEED